MDEKSLVFGVSYAIDSLIMALLKENIPLNLDEDYYVNISPPPIPNPIDFGDAVISGIFVDVTEDWIKAAIRWLRDRENEHMGKPKMQICIDGNLLNVNVQDLEILLDVLKRCAEKKRAKK
ncbi:MAG: hypothetical protein IAX21_06430 [Candidatus Bathyarchaeota archaeon]|nr:hypothetical protein [Candidatus Bathyarchaeum tardum]WGM89411.1 MAG: hypothetical protein NUK63_11000 [Candidatus Bathyarchaeum tardum]WNZ28309.1 MAG: hypothetical protein IAX21_06430 [Candidatus Bathyarchaeota archaeon]